MVLPEFYNTLLISSIFPYRTEKYSIISPPTKRHMFLNGLALLLNGSHQCTSVYPWLAKKQLLITRNEALTDNDQTYFKQFFGSIRIYSRFCLIQDQEGMDETHSQLKYLVFQYNKEKCIKRILNPLFNDVISNLEQVPNFDVDILCQNITIGKLKKGSADYIYLKEQNIPLKEYISTLFNWIEWILSHRVSIGKDKNNGILNIIEDFQIHCQFLYHSNIFRSILSSIYSNVHEVERILYFLDKTSAHLRSLNLICKCLEQRTFDYGEIYKNIQWYFIEPIKGIVKLSEKPSETFDKIWSSSCGLLNDQMKIDFQRQYMETKFDVYDSTLELSICLHCEIRMIDYLIEQNIHELLDNDIEIGISKLPCYSCSLYIDKLNQKYHRTFCVATLTTHGKIYAKWAFRTNEDVSIKDHINNELYALVVKELQQLQRSCRTKSGESDKQETDLDDDEVENKLAHRDLKNIIKRS